MTSVASPECLNDDALVPRPSPGPMVAPRRKLDLVVVDGHPVVRHGVRLFASGNVRIRLVGEARSGEEAIEVARRNRPDLILVDPWLSDMLIDELVERLGATAPPSRVILFAAQITPTIRDEAARLGVHGCLGKNASAEHFLEVITAVAAGELVSEPVDTHLLRLAAAKLGCPALTPREHEILRRAARGESNVEIARAIYLAPTTVKSYLQSALRKLGARNRVEAVFMLSELRLL
jgi:two-component system, NarL family, nitrate/nitrite response regulator NarL